MIIIKFCLVLGWFVVVPFVLGLLFTEKIEGKRDSFFLAVLCGYTLMFALFELICVPAIFLKNSFTVLCLIYGGLVGVLFLWSLVNNRKRIFTASILHVKQIKTVPLIMWLALILIGIQAGAYVVGMATDLDDSLYVATATTTMESNQLFVVDCYTGRILRSLPERYVLSPFPIFLAFLSKVTGFHPTIMAHTIQPVFFLSLSYGVYYLLGEKLFKGDKKSTGLFLCFVSIITMFSYYSVYTQGTFALIRIWQGKALLAAMLLPFLFYFAWNVLEQNLGKAGYLQILCLMTACCLVSSMGIMLAPVMLGILTLLLGVFQRQWKKTLCLMGCCIPCVVCAGLYLAMV